MNWKTIIIISLFILGICLYYGSKFTSTSSLYACPGLTVDDILTPIDGSQHLMMSAYKDYREGGATRILAIINRDHPTSLYCVFCCSGYGLLVKEGAVQMHSVHYGYLYVAADVLCSEEPGCNPTHVTLANHQDAWHIVGRPFLTIQNKERREKDFPVFLTVCMSTVFGGYNNALQFVQTMELYKLFGVQKVVLYLTDCGRDLSRVLQHYVEEGTLEIVPWLSQELNGNIHLNGQLSVMNECIYRNMYSSQYVLLADVDQLFIPYKHISLRTLMVGLQAQHPEASVFQVETHVFPLTAAMSYSTRPSGEPELKRMPVVDILKYVYREPIQGDDFRSYKMVVNPRLVVQTAMFEVLKNYGKTVKVPSDVCKVMEVKEHQGENTATEHLVLDKRLWDFADRLAPNVDQVMQKIRVDN